MGKGAWAAVSADVSSSDTTNPHLTMTDPTDPVPALTPCTHVLVHHLPHYYHGVQATVVTVSSCGRYVKVRLDDSLRGDEWLVPASDCTPVSTGTTTGS